MSNRPMEIRRKNTGRLCDIAQKDVKDASSYSNGFNHVVPPLNRPEAGKSRHSGLFLFFYQNSTTPWKLAKAHHGAEIPYVMEIWKASGKAEKTDLDLPMP